MKRLIIAATPLLLAVSVARADREISVSDLSAQILESINKSFPNSKIIKVEEDSKAGAKYYEIKIQDGHERKEIYVRPDGSIFKKELEEMD